MRQAGSFRDTLDRSTRGNGTAFWTRWAPPLAFFAVAFAADMATGQRASSIWGSVAIVASITWLFPGIRATLAALGSYAAIWVAFNIVRAVADDVGLAVGGQHLVARWESAIAGGTLPSTILQDRFFNPASTGVHDIALAVVHGSFFVVPFVVAILTWWRRRDLFPTYALATAATFALGLVGFLLLPTAPPWMAAPDEVTRVTHHVLDATTDLAVDDQAGGFTFEPNPIAAMPSVHVAATVLVFLLARRFGTVAGVIGAAYAVAMSVAVVYLGEHYVLDALAGWAVAVAGWLIATRLRKVWSP